MVGGMHTNLQHVVCVTHLRQISDIGTVLAVEKHARRTCYELGTRTGDPWRELWLSAILHYQTCGYMCIKAGHVHNMPILRMCNLSRQSVYI